MQRNVSLKNEAYKTWRFDSFVSLEIGKLRNWNIGKLANCDNWKIGNWELELAKKSKWKNSARQKWKIRKFGASKLEKLVNWACLQNCVVSGPSSACQP